MPALELLLAHCSSKYHNNCFFEKGRDFIQICIEYIPIYI
jgi:hypothetical protein